MFLEGGTGGGTGFLRYLYRGRVSLFFFLTSAAPVRGLVITIIGVGFSVDDMS